MIDTTIGLSYTTKEELEKLMIPDEKWDAFLLEICQFVISNNKEWKEWRKKHHEN